MRPLAYIRAVSTPLPSPIPASAVLPATPVQAASALAAVVPATGVASAAQVAPILAAAQAALANTLNLSAEAQQAIKAEAFAKLVAQLVQHIQGGTVQMPSNWPAGGVTPQWQALLQALVQQGSAAQPLPQQLVSVQSWPAALAQAVLQQGAQTAASPTPGSSQGAAPPAGPSAPSTLSPTPSGSSSASVAAGAAPSAAVQRPAIPPLQNWLVQQGVLQGPDGERAFTLTVKVPVAWAQAQSALGQALPAASSTAGSAVAGLQLPFAGSVQHLASGVFGLVLQPQGLPAAQAQAMRTSAVLQLEFQPMPQAVASPAQQAVSASLLPVGMLPQDAYQALLARGTDPWLQMGQMQASGQLPRERHGGQHHGECDVAGCQYQGRAECAQPFCAEMNSLWAAARTSRR